MMRPRTPILATLTAVLAVGVPVWPLAAGLSREAREIPQQVQDGQRLVDDTFRVSNSFPARSQAPQAAAPEAGAARTLTGVQATREDGDVLIALAADGKLTASAVQVPNANPARLVLDFPGVAPKVPATTPVGIGSVRRVRVARHSDTPLVTRVVVDLTGTFLYKVRPAADARGLVITVGDPAQRARRDDEAQSRAFGPARSAATRAAAAPAPAAVVPASASAAPAPAPAPAAARAATAKPATPRPAAPAKASGAAPATTARKAATPPVPAVAATAPAAVPAPAIVNQGMSEGKYTGHPISLDFQGVDLRAVLRTFAEVTGLNMVIDPGVKGTVDVTLRDVPWDQALEMILRANQLAYSVDGTIVRIAPMTTFSSEAADRRKQAEERLRELAVSKKEYRTVRLSYANATDLADLVKKTGLTTFGDVQVDENTNTMILFDIPEGISKAEKLIGELDRPQQQVEIEARIVLATKNTARDLGVVWGVGGRMTPELGNTTNLAFPNSIIAQGNAGERNPNVQGGVTLNLGSVNGALNLDVTLSALESQEKASVIMRPRVVTQNNVKAEITRGEEIPYTTLTAPPADGGLVLQQVPQVQFKTAALRLSVTPRITEAGTVILDVDVDNGSRGAEQRNGNFSINTQRVVTRVLVADQGTTVIGGINAVDTIDTLRRTPGLHRIPFIGRLFQRDINTNNDYELLVFITPRIIRDGGPVK